MITNFSPGHDARLLSTTTAGGIETVNIAFEFSTEMDCDSVTQSLSFNSSINAAEVPQIQPNSVSCSSYVDSDVPIWPGSIASTWSWSAVLENVANGIHTITVRDPSAVSGNQSTNAADRFLIRIGQDDNPLVFPRGANYSRSLVTRNSDDELAVSHAAAGADLWRYSTNWGTSWSYWMPYGGGEDPVPLLPWNGTKDQAWSGHHVMVQYWSSLAGSSDHMQEGDSQPQQLTRRLPHVFLNGPFNQYGYDAGIGNQFELTAPGKWDFYFSTEWPAIAQVNVWGINPDGQPDQSRVYGDIDSDSVLDRLPPSQLSPAVVNITQPPPSSHVAWMMRIDDGTLRYQLLPSGKSIWQLIVYVLLWVVPMLGGLLAAWLFAQSFYSVKFEKFGLVQRVSFFTALTRRMRKPKTVDSDQEKASDSDSDEITGNIFKQARPQRAPIVSKMSGYSAYSAVQPAPRRTVLIATMEYDIEDWEVKVKVSTSSVTRLSTLSKTD